MLTEDVYSYVTGPEVLSPAYPWGRSNFGKYSKEEDVND